jgi:hypothetical protein
MTALEVVVPKSSPMSFTERGMQAIISSLKSDDRIPNSALIPYHATMKRKLLLAAEIFGYSYLLTETGDDFLDYSDELREIEGPPESET